mgnify:CR=1 FL=1
MGTIGLMVLVFVVAVSLAWPWRETAIADDWAYARMVEHWLKTGSYQWHPWAAANMPFQIAVGGLFTRVFGNSMAALRLSSLALAWLGWVAFYLLAREQGLSAAAAWLLSAAFFCSPLAFHLSFTFLSDVPFLALSTMALWLTTRALRKNSYLWMLLGSSAAAAAILVRQFGVALPAGLVLLWIFTPARFKNFGRYASGTVLPALAGLWQITAGLSNPSWGARYNRTALLFYWGDWPRMLGEWCWRLAVILEYLAFFVIPLLVAALLTGVTKHRQDRLHWSRYLVIGTALLGALAYGIGRLGKPALMPFIPWYLEILKQLPLATRIAVTVLTTAGAVWLAGVFLRRYAEDWRVLTTGERWLDLATLGYVPMYLLFFQLGDAYLLVFLPWVLIVLGRRLGPDLLRFKLPVTATAAGLLMLAIIWTRGVLAEEEAYWRGAQQLMDSGINADEIYSSWTWVCYHRFDKYLEQIGGENRRDLKEFWGRWLPAQQERARYWVTAASNPPAAEHWRVLGDISYRDALCRPRRLFIVRRERPQQRE